MTTSMLRNSAKSKWLREEIDWPAELAPCAANWDGLLPWFMTVWQNHEVLRQDTALRGWHRAARNAFGSIDKEHEPIGLNERLSVDDDVPTRYRT